jgi:RHS repeat-associated protein
VIDKDHLTAPLHVRVPGILLSWVRVITDSTGHIQWESDFEPFAVERSITNNVANIYKFTGKELDAESGNYYFGARHHATGMGRFMTPDSSPKSIAPLDPQSWNLYSYTRNRPTRLVDVEGNWATDVHAQIVTYALQGYMSAGELDELRARQYVMDSDQSNQIKHAMANHGQSSQHALIAMWQFVGSEMTIASEHNSGGTLNKAGLDALGDAMHTVQDFTSPEHTDANLMPMEWKGGFWPPWKMGPGAAHVLGEGSPEADWSRIGYAMRRSMAAYLQSGAGCETGKRVPHRCEL